MFFNTSDRYTIILILSHTFIGIGLFYINVFHTSSVFENRNNFSHLSKIEREMLFSSEHGLYFSFYKTIVEADNFSEGYNQLLYDNVTEYPSTINSIYRFDIYPEIWIGYLYKNFKNFTNNMGIKTVSCWAVDRGDIDPIISCEGLGEAVYFYLEFTWYFAGLTVFMLYMYGTYLNRNFIGGITTIIYFFIIHNDATRSHLVPTARENFAFPFIIWQFFYLTISIERSNYGDIFRKSRVHSFFRRNYSMIIKQTLLTTLSLLMWQFSSVIFATQTIIIFLMLLFNLIEKNFIIDYAFSQILSNILSYYIKYNNKYYLISVHNILSLSLMLYTTKFLVIRSNKNDNHNITENSETPSNQQVNEEELTLFQKIRYFINELFIYITITTCSFDIILRMDFFKNNNYNKNNHYFDLLLATLRVNPPTFNTILYLSDPQFSYIDLKTVKSYNNVFFIKFFSLFIIIFLGRLLHRHRNRNKNKLNNKYTNINKENIDRIENYLLEDFLEENHIKLNDLINYEKEYNKELDILRNSYNYNYELYKLEKFKSIDNENNEKINFLNDIKKLKEQINENEKNSEKNNISKKSSKKISMNKLKQINNKTIEENSSNPKGNESIPAQQQQQSDTQSTPIQHDNNNKKSNTDNSLKSFIFPHYLYNIIQISFFVVMAGLFMKLKYILTPFLCLIASTFPPKNWFYKNNLIYWLCLIILLVCGISDPGLDNLKKQYKHDEYSNSKLEELLTWINIHTETNAVFAGPYDITPSILLVTRRPIVNHPHHELHDMEERTMQVYSIFSKKQSSEIYNNLAKIKVQYVVLPYKECFLPLSAGWKMSEIWDYVDPENKNNPQFCVELFQKPNPSFLIVFNNEKYLVIKMFSQSVELELKKINIVEYNM